MPDPDQVLSASGLSVSYSGTQAVSEIAFELRRGEVLALCGPNGCGKSSALKAVRGLVPHSGAITVMDTPARDLTARDFARKVAMLGQSPRAPEEMLVRELVGLGRFAHRSALSGPSSADRAAVEAAIRATDLEALADRTLGALSGGQLQRAWLAMVIAQRTPILFLDEPTNHLDISHALSTLSLVQRLARAEGTAVLVVLHDLNLAAAFADRIVLMKAGRVMRSGPVNVVFEREILSEVFEITCEVTRRPDSNRPLFIPLETRL